MESATRTKISSFMSYIIRHNPMGLEISKDGFVPIPKLVDLMRKRYPWLDEGHLREIVVRDRKGRYEITDNKIRALYGHSIDASPPLSLSSIETLYHGTTKESAEKILTEGLKPMGRKKVHLSRSIEDAIDVGRRRTNNPVVLQIDCKAAMDNGIKVEKATDRVYCANYIPVEYISKKDL